MSSPAPARPPLAEAPPLRRPIWSSLPPPPSARFPMRPPPSQTRPCPNAAARPAGPSQAWLTAAAAAEPSWGSGQAYLQCCRSRAPGAPRAAKGGLGSRKDAQGREWARTETGFGCSQHSPRSQSSDDTKAEELWDGKALGPDGLPVLVPHSQLRFASVGVGSGHSGPCPHVLQAWPPQPGPALPSLGT